MEKKQNVLRLATDFNYVYWHLHGRCHASDMQRDRFSIRMKSGREIQLDPDIKIEFPEGNRANQENQTLS